MDAFEAVYRQHGSRLFGLACRMTGSTADGEDLLQEIFLQAFRKLDSFKGQSTLGTWLYRLAVNLCLDFVRGKQARAGRVTDWLDERDQQVAATAPMSAVTQIDLERAIARLPPGCRAAFVLHDVEGYEHHEVAELLGVAEGTSKSQVFKARLKLRAALRGVDLVGTQAPRPLPVKPVTVHDP